MKLEFSIKPRYGEGTDGSDGKSALSSEEEQSTGGAESGEPNPISRDREMPSRNYGRARNQGRSRSNSTKPSKYSGNKLNNNVISMNQGSSGYRNHTPSNFFVFDIETVPCIETARKLLNLDSEIPDADVIQKLTEYHLEATKGQNEFHRQPFHKVVCLSFISGQITTTPEGKERYSIKYIKTGGRKSEGEREIVRQLFEYLGKSPPRLVSFNGRTFDFPVLQYRAMKHGVQAPWVYTGGLYNYNHRYTQEKHFDLIDAFSNFGASARVKMSEAAALLEVPCKLSADGSEVLTMYNEGRIEEICDYCETDVFCTYALFLRFMHHAGKLSSDCYNQAIDDLMSKLKAEDAPKHWQEYASLWSSLNDGEFHFLI